MKFRLTTEFIFVMFGLVSVQPSWSEIQWNPSLSETQKVAILKQLKEHDEKLRKQGLHVVISQGNGALSSHGCWVGILGSTNVVMYKPLPSQAFDARLFDQDGKEIKKTSFGAQFGKTPKPDRKLLDGTFRLDPEVGWGRSRELQFPTGDGNSHYWDFDLLKSFRVKEAGQYRLQVEVRLFVKDTNGLFQPFVLPPAATTVEIRESDFH